MKKYSFYLWIIALVGLITSCSQDESDALQPADESNRVTLTASLPEDFAQIGTRALPSADNHQLRCILEVWTKDGSPELKCRMEKAGLTGDNVVFDFTIEEGTYDCLFWADFIATGVTANQDATIGGVKYTHYADKYYNTTDTDNGNGLKAISLIEDAYAGGFNNDARDAFFGHYELTKGKTAVENPSIPALTRPFAKLTIKEKNTANYSYCSGLTAKYKVPNTFNVLDETVGSTTVTVTCDSKSTESQVLFSDYIFTDATSTLDGINLTFTGTEGKTLPPVTIPAGIPLKRNYKTNATGNLIQISEESEDPTPTTDGVKLSVTMNDTWGNPDEEYDMNTDATVWDGKYPTSVEEAKEWMGPADEASPINHVFTINTARQLAALHYLMSYDQEQEQTGFNYYDATYRLATDINLNEKPWIPIGRGEFNQDFHGVFDGQGHTVRGMNVISKTVCNGLFGGVSGSKAIIKHLNVKGKVASNITTNQNRIHCGGGIAGYLLDNACIAFCSFEGEISITTQDYDLYGGGIVGELTNTEQIISCYSVVTAMNLATNKASAKGGIAGYAIGGTIKGCYWKELTGINNIYGECMSGYNVTEDNNSTFNNAANLNAAVGTMNQYSEGYDYEWQAGIDGGYPVLVPKQQ